MALGFFYFLGGLGLLIIIILAVWLIRISSREAQDPENNKILFNLMPQYGKGHKVGSIESLEESEYMTKIVFYPRDLNYIRMMKKEKNIIIEPITEFFYSKNVHILPSGDRTLVIALPTRVEDIPEDVKRTSFGKIIIGAIGKNEEDISEAKALRRIITSQTRIQQERLSDKMLLDHLEQVAEINSSIQRPQEQKVKEE